MNRFAVVLFLFLSGCNLIDNKTLDLVCSGEHSFTDLKFGESLKEKEIRTYTFSDGLWDGYMKTEWTREKISYREESNKSCTAICYRTLNIDRISGSVTESHLSYPSNGRVYESKFIGQCTKGTKKF